MDKDYTVEEFHDGRGTVVTARVVPVSQDGSNQAELAKALIKTGAIAKVRGGEFQIIDDQIRVIFPIKSNTRFNIEPRLADYQALLSTTISRALEIERFFAAFEMMRKQEKK